LITNSRKVLSTQGRLATSIGNILQNKVYPCCYILLSVTRH